MAFAVGNCGSLPFMTGWMLNEVSRPCCFVQVMNAFGSGNSALFQFQPSHWFGDFQSVSTTSQSSGVKVLRNAGSSVFS